ncbi:M43 family zinc metalloprotease [Rubrivirga sp.]|uniref:M43 family zinc metalloprotease n=1 Tax=Rubrivirga sp. TaxID=1885344 RepID=UPI003B516C70
MRLALVLLAVLVAAPASAQAVVLDGRRCATPEPTVAQALATARLVRSYAVGPLDARLAEPVTVPVAVHVIRSGPGVAEGNIPDAWVEAQIDTLNAAFGPLGLRFALSLIDRVDNASWYDDLALGTPQEREMKAALALDPSRVLNLYTASLGLDYLGWATLPEETGEADTYQGVVLLDQALPGGNAVPYHLGHTATHEVGHWAGLYHTFSGGCSAPNDGVEDTPQQRRSTSRCPSPAPDSCPADPGLDPVHNYMDYSDDACMTEFTVGQAARAQAMLGTFRPTILAGGYALATTPRGGLDELFVGVEATVPVWVTNATGGPLTVERLTASGAEVRLAAPATVAPGEVARLAVAVRPTRAGAVTLRVATDTGVSPDLLALQGTAVVPPTAALGPAALAARVIEGGTAERTVTLANTGGGTLAFDLTSRPSWIEAVSPASGTVPAGGSVTITVTFASGTLPPGEVAGPLVIATNDPLRGDVSVGLDLDVLLRPTALGVGAIYPNPGRRAVTVPLRLPDDLDVWADVVDLRGRVVAVLADATPLPVGYPELRWDASAAAPGVYLVRVRTAAEAALGRVVIVR